MSLHLAVNGTQHGVIFEAVPVGLSPVVVLYGERKSVRLLKISRSDMSAAGEGQGDCQGGLTPTPSLKHCQAGGAFDPYSLLHEVADLAVLRRKELEEDDRAISPGGSPSQSPSSATSVSSVDLATLLEYPFCVDVSVEVIVTLIELLESFTAEWRESSSAEAEQRVLSVLAILDVQFYSLNKSQVQPAQVGLAEDDGDRRREESTRTAASLYVVAADASCT